MTPAGREKRWKIVKGWNHEPEPGSDREFARSYKLERDGRQSQATVEFVSLAGGSPNAALLALRPFLRKEELPPRRLLVGRDGTAGVLE